MGTASSLTTMSSEEVTDATRMINPLDMPLIDFSSECNLGDALSQFFNIPNASPDDMSFLLHARRFGISHAKLLAKACRWQCDAAIRGADRFAN
jgi:hypothetical protein